LVKKGDQLYYRYGKALRPLASSRIARAYRTGPGRAKKDVTGVPAATTARIVRSADGPWIACAD